MDAICVRLSHTEIKQASRNSQTLKLLVNVCLALSAIYIFRLETFLFNLSFVYSGNTWPLSSPDEISVSHSFVSSTSSNENRYTNAQRAPKIMFKAWTCRNDSSPRNSDISCKVQLLFIFRKRLQPDIINFSCYILHCHLYCLKVNSNKLDKRTLLSLLRFVAIVLRQLITVRYQLNVWTKFLFKVFLWITI